jgi:hypothetical protein
VGVGETEKEVDLFDRLAGGSACMVDYSEQVVRSDKDLTPSHPY